MMQWRRSIIGDPMADRIVPPSGHSARLTVLTAAAMGFLAVFALALSLATSRLADRWANELARSSTVKISASRDQMAAQTAAAIRVLETTTGISEIRALSSEEQAALLAPWFGGDLPVEQLPIPQLIEVIEDDIGFDRAGLRARLAAELPDAVLDDHSRWRQPLIQAAERVRWLGIVALGLIALTMAAVLSLAARAALASNGQVIRVLRLVGARDDYIAGAFVRRFTLRAVLGAALGAGGGVLGMVMLPDAYDAGGFLIGIRFEGADWLSLSFIPLLAGLIAFIATRRAALFILKGNS